MLLLKKLLNKKGLTLIETLIALLILIFPIFATLSSVIILHQQTNSRNLELLAENLSNYILEDLRGRKFYCATGCNPLTSLSYLYDNLISEQEVPNPFYPGSQVIMRYDENISVNSSNNYIDFNFLKSDGVSINIENFYKTFKFDLYITQYPLDIINPNEVIYKIDLVVKWKEGKRDRLLKSSTEVAYHEP